MARDYLAVAGSGVPVEGFFSSGPDLLSPRRRSMECETVRRSLCLRNWFLRKETETCGMAELYMKAVKDKILSTEVVNEQEYEFESNMQ